MMFKLCPSCRSVNDPDAVRCEDCGGELGPGGAATVPAFERAPARVELTSRDLPRLEPAGMAMQHSPSARASAADSDGCPLVFPTLHESLLPAETPAADRAEPVPHEPQESQESQARVAHALARAAQRAAVRRARLQASAAAIGSFVPEVLVLDRDAHARDRLSSLLRLFGFGVIGVADACRAAVLLAERPFAAVFADIALDGTDGGAGIEFCRSRHEAPSTSTSTSTSMLVLVSAPLNAVDRVRAQLLGFDGMLCKPVQRGDVARVLDASGVALPLDERRY